MLHKDPFVISSDTFSLIQQLQQLDELKHFYLVGGTALALKLGHRNSIDIDLFTSEEFLPENIIDLLRDNFTFELYRKFKNGILGFINEVKVDFVRHNYPLVKPPITEEGITYLSLGDIAAMKLHAISNSGKRLKDFIDIYFLLEHFSFEEMVSFYSVKYPDFNPLIMVRAVNYFEDIDPALDPPKLRHELPLEKIKSRIHSAVKLADKKF
jgi:hypothetical protein